MRIDRSSSDLLAADMYSADYQRLGDSRRPFLRTLAYWRSNLRVVLESPRTGAVHGWYSFMLGLDRFFELSARGSTLGTEVWAGCVSFMTMSYVMLVIPVLLYNADRDLVFESLVTATAVSTAFGSLLAGLLGNAPVGVTPGLRLSAYLTFGFCKVVGVTWGEAMSCVFMCSVLLLMLSVLGVCDWIAREVLSDHLKKAIAVAMGIFQATIGFQMMGAIDADSQDYVTLANLQSGDELLIFVVCCFCLISGLLVVARVNGALLVSITLVAIASWATGYFRPPDFPFARPRFDMAFTMDFSGWLPGSPRIGKLAIGTAVMLLVAISDIVGVQYGLFSIAGLLRHGVVPRSSSIVASTALASILGSLLGSGPLVIANESSAGILEGARTGLSAVVVAMLFACSAFMTPLLSSIPDLAAAAPLIFIGAFMMEPSRSIAWDNLRVGLPSFLAITLIPHSIHHGIVTGIVVDMLLGLAERFKQRPEELPAAEEDLTARLWQFLRQPQRGAPVGVGVAGGPPRAGEGSPMSPRLLAGTPLKARRLMTPHSCVSVGIGLKEHEKIERVRELLRDLGPPVTGMQASETWEMALRKALETYLEGAGHRMAEQRQELRQQQLQQQHRQQQQQ
eukprot:CAMPEP_0176086958 /NCGR_PEP_ID=MMETSP0120_2-20121206/43530_1 /TAXON_ID=160619 /ORGANISM="Kryptoperidinium foliaceum, Strain CCMP 1326" /LENGTH=621 /DNA_ID=CAMNT_0017420793 /DNA_START=102 /DNA_END=1964 /DNA_ORIENTATION=+